MYVMRNITFNLTTLYIVKLSKNTHTYIFTAVKSNKING